MDLQREARFKVLYDDHYGRVLGYALRRAAAEDAKEVSAEVWLIAWRRLDEIPTDGLPWLLGVARRVLANRRRALDRRGALQERLFRSPFESARQTDHAEAIGRRDEIKQALAGLPARDREILLLVAWDGLEHRQAAAAMGCSSSVFSLRLHRARKRFSKELAAAEHSSAVAPLPKLVEEAK